MLMLTPTTDTVDMATDVATTVVTAEDTTEDTMGRGLPSLLLQLSLALRLNLVTATVVATMVVTDIEDTTATGKGLLSPLLWLNQLLTPSQRLPLTPTMDTAVAMEDTMEDTEEATMAGARRRGLQIPTMDTDIAVATTATVDTVEDTGAELNRLLTLSLNFTLATISSNSDFTCTAESQ